MLQHSMNNLQIGLSDPLSLKKLVSSLRYGQGQGLDNRKDTRSGWGLPKFSFDHCFPFSLAGDKLTIFHWQRVTDVTAVGDPLSGLGLRRQVLRRTVSWSSSGSASTNRETLCFRRTQR